MAKRRSRRTKGYSSVGSLFLGIFIGILATLAILGGVGLWAYNNVTLAKLEGWFNFNINLNSDPANIKKMSIGELLALGQSYADNYDSITLQDLENDFGIIFFEDGDYAIENWSEIKAVAIYDLFNDASVIVDQFTLDSLETLGKFSFPDMPLFNKYKQGGALEGTSVLTFVDDLIEIMDVETMLFSDLQTHFGFELPDNALINRLKLCPLDDMQNSLEEIMADLTLDDLNSLGVDFSDSIFFESFMETKLSELPQAIADKLNPDTLTISDLCDLTGATAPGNGWNNKTLAELLLFLQNNSPD